MWISVHTCCQRRRCLVDTIPLTNMKMFDCLLLWGNEAESHNKRIILLFHGSLCISISQLTCLPLCSLWLAFLSASQAHLWCLEAAALLSMVSKLPAPTALMQTAFCWHQWLCSKTAQAAPPPWMHGQERGWTGNMNHSYPNSTSMSCHEGISCKRTQLLKIKQKKKYKVSSRILNYLCCYLNSDSNRAAETWDLDKAAWKLHLVFEYASLRTAILTAFSHLLK